MDYVLMLLNYKLFHCQGTDGQSEHRPVT